MGRDRSKHPRARNYYDEEAAYGINMNPTHGILSGPEDSTDGNYVLCVMLCTKPSPPSGGPENRLW